MAPNNYDMAIECLRSAERAGIQHTAVIEAMAAQTYATLALVDAVRDLREPTAAELLDAAERALAATKDGAK